jgi:putative ABC transport system ATP-binding protein
MGMQDKTIALHDVDLSLGRGAARVHILKGISLEVDRGEAVGLIGPRARASRPCS